jgi:hypothetical protein
LIRTTDDTKMPIIAIRFHFEIIFDLLLLCWIFHISRGSLTKTLTAGLSAVPPPHAAIAGNGLFIKARRHFTASVRIAHFATCLLLKWDEFALYFRLGLFTFSMPPISCPSPYRRAPLHTAYQLAAFIQSFKILQHTFLLIKLTSSTTGILHFTSHFSLHLKWAYGSEYKFQIVPANFCR